jgi:hypothetical protein
MSSIHTFYCTYLCHLNFNYEGSQINKIIVSQAKLILNEARQWIKAL